MQNKCAKQLKADKKLIGKNVLIITDECELNSIKTLIRFLNESGASVQTSREVSLVHSTFDFIIFHEKLNPKRKYWEAKKCFKNFVSLLFIEREISDAIEVEFYENFNSIIQSIESFCPFVDQKECDGMDCIVYYQYLFQTIKSAVFIREKRSCSYKKALNDLINNFPSHSEYTFFTIIDGVGEIIAMDNTMKNIFGDLVGKNVDELDYCIDYKKVKVGSEFVCCDTEGDEIKIRLVYTTKLINGIVYYLQIWEKADRIDSMNNIIEEMDVLNEKINHFREELYANSG
jgi:hypothetical protein